MKRSRFTEEQIIAIVKEQEAETKTADVCCRRSISDATFHEWKAEYGGTEVSEAIWASPKTVDRSLKARFVVTMVELCS